MDASSRKLLQRRHIQALVAVADGHSVHRAARELRISQPAVSRLLAEAERLLGEKIFERSVRGSLATRRGEAVLAHARFLLRGLERLDTLTQDAGPAINLGCIPRAMHTLMPQLLKTMFPATMSSGASGESDSRVRLSVIEDRSDALFEAVGKGDLDFAVLRHAAGAAGIGESLAVERLYEERPVIICAPQNTVVASRSVALAKLAGHGWVLPAPETISRTVFDRFWALQGLAPLQPLIETRTFESNLALVADTNLLSVIPEPIARRYAALGMVRIVRVQPALPASPVMLVFHPIARKDPVLEAFRQMVHTAAAAVGRSARASARPR